MDADAEEKKKELKRLQDKVQLQNREMERMHKRIVELADSERMEARVATMRLELDRQASASAATIRKLHAQVLAQAKQCGPPSTTIFAHNFTHNYLFICPWRPPPHWHADTLCSKSLSVRLFPPPSQPPTQTAVSPSPPPAPPRPTPPKHPLPCD